MWNQNQIIIQNWIEKVLQAAHCAWYVRDDRAQVSDIRLYKHKHSSMPPVLMSIFCGVYIIKRRIKVASLQSSPLLSVNSEQEDAAGVTSGRTEATDPARTQRPRPEVINLTFHQSHGSHPVVPFHSRNHVSWNNMWWLLSHSTSWTGCCYIKAGVHSRHTLFFVCAWE